MMLNRRGQMFGLYLVFVTLFFCGTTVMLFHIQQSKLTNSLVSPVEVLSTVDSSSIFEMWEKEQIRSAFSDASRDGLAFGTSLFLKKFRESFLNKADEGFFMVGFSIEDVTLNGENIWEMVEGDRESFLKNVLYPENLMKYDDGAISITHGDVGLSQLLVAKNEEKINFPIRFNFELGGKYLVSEGDVSCSDSQWVSNEKECGANLNIRRI